MGHFGKLMSLAEWWYVVFEACGAAGHPTSVLMAFHLYQVEGTQDSPLGMGTGFPKGSFKLWG